MKAGSLGQQEVSGLHGDSSAVTVVLNAAVVTLETLVVVQVLVIELAASVQGRVLSPQVYTVQFGSASVERKIRTFTNSTTFDCWRLEMQ